MPAVTQPQLIAETSSHRHKHSSEDETANVNFFYDDIAHVLQNTKKKPTSFNKLDDS